MCFKNKNYEHSGNASFTNKYHIIYQFINFPVLTSYPGRGSEEVQMQHSQCCYFLSSMQIDLSAICNERDINFNFNGLTMDYSCT